MKILLFLIWGLSILFLPVCIRNSNLFKSVLFFNIRRVYSVRFPTKKSVAGLLFFKFTRNYSTDCDELLKTATRAVYAFYRCIKFIIQQIFSFPDKPDRFLNLMFQRQVMFRKDYFKQPIELCFYHFSHILIIEDSQIVWSSVYGVQSSYRCVK